jgi:hypothetical protein
MADLLAPGGRAPGDRGERIGAGWGNRRVGHAFITDHYRVAKRRLGAETAAAKGRASPAERQLDGRSLLQASDQRQLERIREPPRVRAEPVPNRHCQHQRPPAEPVHPLVESTGNSSARTSAVWPRARTSPSSAETRSRRATDRPVGPSWIAVVHEVLGEDQQPVRPHQAGKIREGSRCRAP